MNDQNTNAAKNAAELERMHPIFDECEENDYGVVKRYHMLSMNGMYISGITDDQLKEMHAKLTELLTGEKPRKYFYAEASIPRKNGDILCKKDFVVETDGDKFPLVDALHHSHAFFEDSKYAEDLDFKNAHICCCLEISKEDYEAFREYRKKNKIFFWLFYHIRVFSNKAKFCQRWLPVRVAIFFLSHKFGFSEKAVYLCTRRIINALKYIDYGVF